MTTDTRTALLDAAEHAARSKGFDGFSYADLAGVVGIRKASIHYHFPTKVTLAAALMERYRTRMDAACDRLSATQGSGGARLLGLIDVYRAALDEGRTLCLCVALTVSRDSLADEVVAELVAFRAGLAAWLGQVFALGGADGSIAGVTDPGAEAQAALACLEGAHLAARGAGDAGVFDGALATLRARCG